MAVSFPSNAPTLTNGISLQKSFRILTTNFGDGYTQRTPDGLNTEIEKWNMIWDTITLSEKNVLTDFFDARQGTEAILFTAPGDSTEKKWIVTSYNHTPINATYHKVTAQFERVYDL